MTRVKYKGKIYITPSNYRNRILSISNENGEYPFSVK
jgi:hypothetical protein